MSFEKQARRQAQILVETLAEAAQTEIKALRAAVEARTGALQKVLSHPEQAQVVEQIVQELSNAAKEEADARVGQARTEVQRQVEAALAAARREVDQTRQELEARLAEAQQAQTAQATALSDAQKHATAARAERDAQAGSFQDAQERLRSVDQEHKKLIAARDEANRLVERETKRAESVKMEVDGLRQELKQRDERIRSLEEGRKQLEADAKARGRADQDGDAAGALLLERVGTALDAISVATTAADVFEALNEHLSKYFNKTVVFQVGASGFKGWLGRGFGKTTDISKLAIPPHVDALLKRTLTERKLVAVPRGGGDPPVGLSNSPIGCAVALPVITSDKVIAVAYAEAAEGTSSSAVGSTLAEILIDHISRRLTTRGKTSASGSPSA